MGEGELIARFAAGDPTCVAEVYRAYGRQVYAVSRRILGDAGLADEATKQTFVMAWRLAATLDPDDDLGRWLATIAGRTAVDIRRRRQTHRVVHTAPTKAGSVPELVSPIPAAGQTGESWRLRGALDALSAQDRELIRLQHHRKLSQTEISDRLAIPLAAVKVRSYRAHRELARLLDRLSAGRKAAESG